MGEVFVILVTPADGWGSPWMYCYHNYDNAIKKIIDLAKRYGMQLRSDCESAFRYGGFNKEYRIEEVELFSECYED